MFNLIFLSASPNLSDDMYRYVWDGRVQGYGVNPYRYASDAPELERLRDNAIWTKMNRLSAHTIYPPAAQAVFAVLWRIAPDDVTIFKIAFIGCSLLCGLLLIPVLRAFGQPPGMALVFLWSPLLIIEVAYSAHVDALYLPLILGAFWLRLRNPDWVNWRNDAGIGLLLGLAVLVKLYPALLAAPLWSLWDAHGKYRLRLAFPLTMVSTVVIGYAIYATPGIDLLGFLPNYGREFFNIAPFPRLLIDLATATRQPYWAFVNPTMYSLVAFTSLAFVIFPARTPQLAIMRCMIPIAIYLIVNMNLFSWYILFILPLVPLSLHPGIAFGFRMNVGLAWLVFSGLVIISYNIFVTGYAQAWEVPLQFLPLYGMLIIAASLGVRFKLSKIHKFRKGISP